MEEFSCCGGSDETPVEHCQDCPAAKEAVQRWAKRADLRDMSDAANQWAEDEAGLTALPSDLGSWKASLAMAFEAGRRFEQFIGRR